MRPKSVAIIGMSSKPNTMSHALLRNLQLNDFRGDIHLVGRTPGEIDGLPVGTDAAGLPEGIDVGILAVPAAGVAEALATCVERKIGAAVVFASGFAELGDDARGEQERIGRAAREGGVAVIGPNCIGYTNYRDGFAVAFANVYRVPRLAPGTNDAVAVVAQSGGLAGHLRLSIETRGVPVSYNITTGNEMGLGLGDFVRFLVDDEATRVVMVYAEHIRNPALFLEAAGAARAAGKTIVMMHSGRSARSQAAAQSHTGALAGDYATMRVAVERAGVLLVDSLDELLDAAEIVVRSSEFRPGGIGILTLSGAYCAIAHDFCESVEVPVPPLAQAGVDHLIPILPAFTPPRNPLDLGTQPIWQPELLTHGLATLMRDEGINAVAISITGGAPPQANAFLNAVVAGRANGKPVALAIHGDSSPLDAQFMQTVRDNKFVLSRSSDRTLRAMGAVVKWINRTAAVADPPPLPLDDIPELAPGPQPEWLGKRVLAAAGITVPRGRLARSADDAVAIATEIGFPVAIKAQAAALTHKTEAGAVVLNVTDADAVRSASGRVITNVAGAQPEVKLDGVLVEAMAPPGIELIVGARRDPSWGPVLLAGLGGIMAEALGDVRLIAVDASSEEILAELRKLRGARVFEGFRGAPPADLPAVARAVAAVGALMRAHPEIVEIDVNPLVAHAPGAGATALDALIVTTANGDAHAG
jgi:acyl-CoA synthetase (NDP forming)